MTWKFKHAYWGDEWQDATPYLYKDQVIVSGHTIAEIIGMEFWNVDPNGEYFETYVEVMYPDGKVVAYQVTGEPEMVFRTYKHRE